MPFKRRAQFNKINHSLPGGADCVTFLPGRGTLSACPSPLMGEGGRRPDEGGLELTPNPCNDSITRLGGGGKIRYL